MKRLALLGLLVPAFVVACGGSSDGGSGDSLAQAPTAPPAPPSAEAEDSVSSEPTAAPQGEEIGEQRGLGGEDEDADVPAVDDEPAAEPDNTPREEDTSRPVAPVLVGSTLDGEPISLEDFKGRPVIVKVFAEH